MTLLARLIAALPVLQGTSWESSIVSTTDQQTLITSRIVDTG
jgi:hypothetical protein